MPTYCFSFLIQTRLRRATSRSLCDDQVRRHFAHCRTGCPRAHCGARALHSARGPLETKKCAETAATLCLTFPLEQYARVPPRARPQRCTPRVVSPDKTMVRVNIPMAATTCFFFENLLLFSVPPRRPPPPPRSQPFSRKSHKSYNTSERMCAFGRVCPSVQRRRRRRLPLHPLAGERRNKMCIVYYCRYRYKYCVNTMPTCGIVSSRRRRRRRRLKIASHTCEILLPVRQMRHCIYMTYYYNTYILLSLLLLLRRAV